MARVGRLRNLLKEVAESPSIEKLSFTLPFIVIVVDVILIEHAIRINEPYIIALTTILFFLSLFEIAVVLSEIHERNQKSSFERILTIKLDDFILQRKKKNVKKLVEDFIKIYPQYKSHRTEIYHIACQIMETHKEEVLEKTLADKLKRFVKRRKKMNVDEMLKAFIKKYPAYKECRGRIYQKICQIMETTRRKT